MAKLNLSSVSHDTSEIIIICWFGAQDTFLLIIIRRKEKKFMSLGQFNASLL